MDGDATSARRPGSAACGRAVENPQLAVGWGDFVDVLDESDGARRARVDPTTTDDVDDVAAAGAESVLAGDAAVSEDDSLPRLSVR